MSRPVYLSTAELRPYEAPLTLDAALAAGYTFTHPSPEVMSALDAERAAAESDDDMTGMCLR